MAEAIVQRTRSLDAGEREREFNIRCSNAELRTNLLTLLRTAMTMTGQNTVRYWCDNVDRLTTVTQGTFTAREDDGTGLYYYRARYSHPATGRFVSEDPLRYTSGVNFYAYVGNRPNILIDPLGLQLYEPPLDCDVDSHRLSPIIDAINDAKKIAAEVRERAVSDKWAHCLASCLLATKYGRNFADAMGILKEARDLSVRGIAIGLGKDSSCPYGTGPIGRAFDSHWQGGSIEDSTVRIAAYFTGHRRQSSYSANFVSVDDRYVDRCGRNIRMSRVEGRGHTPHKLSRDGDTRQPFPS